MPTAQVHISQLNDIIWNDGSLCPFIVNDGPDVWKISISDNVQYLDRFWYLLSTDEQTRANGYHREQDRQRFIISRGYLRALLSKYLGLPARSIIFKTGENNKPAVKAGQGSIHYNVSHSGNYILIAVGTAAVGADVEQRNENIHFDDIMEISFSVDEIACVKNAIEPVWVFYTLWTRKESMLKATGKGIDDDIKHVPSTGGTHIASPEITGAAGSWFVTSFDVDKHYSGCVAATFKVCNFWNITGLNGLN